jgi:hypothetical protein
MSEMKIPIQMHPGQAPGVHTWSFHRPMSAFFDALISNGLLISGLEEWVSHRKSLPGGRSRTENASREEIPLFMAIAGAKT